MGQLGPVWGVRGVAGRSVPSLLKHVPRIGLSDLVPVSAQAR